jgi:hypothetical protein
MKEVNPDSYCGIYCGACSVSMHGVTGRTDGFVACLGSVPKEDLACSGCKSDTLYNGCRVCGFRECAGVKGVEHCIDCVDYPCKMFKKWQSAAKFLPHVREAAISLATIKRDGADTWLAAQNKRWSCPDCGEPFSWYTSDCHKCGCKYTTEAYEISGWKKLLCRFVLPMVYRKGKKKMADSA